jgi:hypothetical protein
VPAHLRLHICPQVPLALDWGLRISDLLAMDIGGINVAAIMNMKAASVKSQASLKAAKLAMDVQKQQGGSGAAAIELVKAAGRSMNDAAKATANLAGSLDVFA